jgi:hypothetical protein
MFMLRAVRPCLLVAALAPTALADVAFNNFGSGDSYHGNGWIVFGPTSSIHWTHAFQFTAQAGGTINGLVVPIQHLQNQTNEYSFEIYSDAGGQPGTSLGVIGAAPGFINNSPPLPPPVTVPVSGSITLTGGTVYWLVGKGTGDAQGTWHQNDQNVLGMRAFSISGGSWITGEVEIGAFRIEVAGGAPCYANCDQSTVAPILNVGDFTCFLQRFAAGDSYANCDQSTVQPVLNVGDFTCFLQRFAAGCP